jgi:hypothetical protein
LIDRWERLRSFLDREGEVPCVWWVLFVAREEHVGVQLFSGVIMGWRLMVWVGLVDGLVDGTEVHGMRISG